MDIEQLLELLRKEFPEGKLVKFPIHNPTAIICEIYRDTFKSIAIAYIDETDPHYHTKIDVQYLVEGGTLHLTVDGITIILNEGDRYIIKRGETQFAKGNSTRVRITATPPWKGDDHILI